MGRSLRTFILRTAVFSALLCACHPSMPGDVSFDVNVPSGNARGYGLGGTVELQITVTVNTPLDFAADPAGGAITGFGVDTPPQKATVTQKDPARLEYAPNFGAVGLDSFQYHFTDTKGAAVNVHVVSDIRPCFRGTGLPMHPSLHVVAAEAYAWEANGIIQVHVQKTDAPTVLVLATNDTLRWKLNVDPGAALARVHVLTGLPTAPPVDGIPAGVPLVTTLNTIVGTGWEPYRQDSPNFATMIGFIRQTYGKSETSFQGCQSTKGLFNVPCDVASLGNNCHIYDANNPQQQPSYYSFANQSCTDHCREFPLSADKWGWQLSDAVYLDKTSPASTLSVSAANRVLESTVPVGITAAVPDVIAWPGHVCGKYYFEIEVGNPGEINLPTFPEPLRLGADTRPPGSNLPTSTPFGYTSGSPAVAAGDRVGVALDLDANLIYFSRNGTWGAAGKPTGLITYDFLYPHVHLNSNAKVTLSLTPTELQYSPPNGFSPWAGTP